MKNKLFLGILLISIMISSVFAVNVNSCGSLTTDDTVYDLTQALTGNTSSGYCIYIDADNVILDFGIYTIVGDDPGLTYGIYINNSNNVTITDGMLNNYAYDFYSESSTNVKVDDMAFEDTIVNYTFSGDIGVSATDPPNIVNTKGYDPIGKYINITAISGTPWVQIYIFYEESDVSGLNESSFEIEKHTLNATGYQENSTIFAQQGEWDMGYGVVNTHDGSWSTYGIPGLSEPKGIIYMNYSKQDYGVAAYTNWQVKDTSATTNLTIDSLCWGQSILQFKSTIIAGPNIEWSCWNGSAWHQLRTGSGNRIYEEGIHWLYQNWDYQESANATGQSGEWNIGNPESNVHDGDWDTYGQTTSGAIYYANYTKIADCERQSVIQVKDGAGTANLSIPQKCWTTSKIEIRARYVAGPAIEWACWNGTAWDLLRTGSSTDRIYEEGIFWRQNLWEADLGSSSVVDTVNNWVSANITNFGSDFGILGGEPEGGGSSVPEFSDLGWILAAVLGAGGFVLIRRKKFI